MTVARHSKAALVRGTSFKNWASTDEQDCVRARVRRAEAEQLLTASGRVARLCSLPDALVAAATESRELVGGELGICCATGTDGRWVGVLVDDNGARTAPDETVAALRELGDATDEAALIDIAAWPLPIRLALPPAKRIVIAPAGSDAPVPLVLAVVPHGGATQAEAALLGRFTTAAALAVGNARLFEQIESAYRQQLDLNRQKDEFVATVSHELRTPIAVMRGSVETLERLGDRLGPEHRAQLLAGALAHGDRLERMIEELLLVATTEQASSRVAVTDIDVAKLLDEVVIATAGSSDGRVVRLGGPVIGRVRTDQHKVRTVLVHLLENAAKFAPDGAIELEAMAAGSHMVFYVTDHGPGIAPADRDRVFERFVQLDQSLTRSSGGLGLGLYLSRQLAQLLGGDLVVTDVAGGGACFCLAIARELTPSPRPREGAVQLAR